MTILSDGDARLLTRHIAESVSNFVVAKPGGNELMTARDFAIVLGAMMEATAAMVCASYDTPLHGKILDALTASLVEMVAELDAKATK